VYINLIIKAFCNKADSKKRIEGIQQILERKHRLIARVKTVTTMLTSPVKGKGKYLASVEPVHCIRHLIELLV